MLKVREISRGGGGDGLETEACNLIAGSDGQAVKMFEYWSHVNTWRYTNYTTDFTILDSLKFETRY